ncbi:hypothetical protein VTJ49DRAFT_6855 [Mycothermus thermophilus]|uniref:Uncharacterized protein n=1 Tax=Humicola insolens TaxID=85995 RepID=A0ABR3VPT0_HUMIN
MLLQRHRMHTQPSSKPLLLPDLVNNPGRHDGACSIHRGWSRFVSPLDETSRFPSAIGRRAAAGSGVTGSRRGKLLLLQPLQLLQRQAALFQLVCLLLAPLFPTLVNWLPSQTLRCVLVAYLLNLLVLSRRLEDGADIIREAQLFQGLDDVVAGDGLLGLLLRDLVGLGADERDELDATLYEYVARFLGEGDPGRPG